MNSVNEHFDDTKYQAKDAKLYRMVAHKGVDLACLRNENMINDDNTKYDVLNLGNDSSDCGSCYFINKPVWREHLPSNGAYHFF